MLKALSKSCCLPVLLMILVVFFACNSEEQAEEVTGKQLVIADAMLSSVSLRSTLSSGDIGVYRLASTGYSETKNNVHYTYSGGWAVASGVTPIYLSKNTASLCAYYPYSSDADYTDGTVSLTSQEYTSAADLCYQTGVTTSSESTSASFALDHVYALITFTLTRGSTYPANGVCAVSDISLANVGIIHVGTLDMTIGSYVATASGSVSYDPAIAGIVSGTPATSSVLMFPVSTAMSGSITLTLMVDGKSMSTTLLASTLSKLEAGTNYSIPITINGTELSVGTVSFTTGWTDQTVTNTVNASSGNMVESNCYIAEPGGVVYIPVSRVEKAWTKINGSSYALPTDWTSGLLWTDNSNGLSDAGAIASITPHVGAGYITVTAGSAKGNSVIALYDSDGSTILWSWHIWTTDEPATEMVNGYVWMDRNLGATAVADGSSVTFATCGGLLYQWGRKDPFPGSDGSTTGNDVTAKNIYNTNGVSLTSSNGNIPCPSSATYIGTTAVSYYDISSVYVSQGPYSINYPLSFFKNWAGSTATAAVDDTTAAGGTDSWGGEYGESKTLFDPCPTGWRVPSGKKASNTYISPWDTWTTQAIFDTFAYAAALWNGTDNAYSYPASGYRYSGSGAIYYVGSNGYYWSASTMNHQGCCLYFGNSYVAPGNNLRRANGISVRCVQEF
jgi:uncharacterized protein (TIGR02145 family)